MNPTFRLLLMMFLQLFIWGAWLPKVFGYMELIGLSDTQQALTGSCFALASIVGIFFSNQLADRYMAAEKFMALSHLCAGTAILGAAFFKDFYPFFACMLIHALFYVPTLSVTNAIAFTHLKDAKMGFGIVRMGGTLGWIAASWPFIFLLQGKSQDVQANAMVFIVAAVASFVLAAYSLTLPHTPAKRDQGGADPLAWLKAVKFLKVPFILILFIVTLLDSINHNGYFVVGDRFLQSIGIDGNMSMVVMSIGQVAEIITMVLLGFVLKALGWKTTLTIGLLGYVIRYGLYIVFGTPDYQMLIIVSQILHGICYAFFFATLYIFIDEVFPKDVRSSAQGLFNLLILGIGQLGAVALFPKLVTLYTNEEGVVNYQSLFHVPFLIALVAGLLLLFGFYPPKEGKDKIAAE